MSSEEAVLYERHGHVAVITLNRPDNRNSMTPELFAAFEATVDRVRGDGEVRCVVLTGRGRCFSSGADFKSQIQSDAGGATLSHERSYAMYMPFLKVLDIEVPVIGALNGHAVGGGFGLSLVCDLRIGNRGSKYGANFARLGLSSGMGISYILPRLVGPARASELMLTGRLVLGDEAEAMGLVNRAVETDEVLPVAMEMAQAIAKSAPIAVRFIKKSLYEGLGWEVRRAAFQEAMAQAITIDTEDVQEGIAALLEKREPVFHGR
jgi:enoyl-CoA hydratase/carnithine racemase